MIVWAVTFLAMTACSVALPGHPGVAPVGAAATGGHSAVGPTVPVAAPPGPRSALDPDPLPDECLLDASQVGTLVGTTVRLPTESVLIRSDGSVSRSCVANAGHDPVAMINVYRVRTGTPADFVRAGGPGRRELSGAGEAAAIVDTAIGPTLQVAGPTYLVTIMVVRGRPGDDAWRSAAVAALARLPG